MSDADGHAFIPDARDPEFCDLCGHPPSDHGRRAGRKPRESEGTDA